MTGYPANLFVIGAMRGGTTTLSAVLDGVAEVHVPEVKEPHGLLSAADRQLFVPNAHRSDFPRQLSEVELTSLYAGAESHRWRADLSTQYLPSPDVACRIAELGPDVRAIAVLREPVARAVSAFTYLLGRGLEPCGTLSEAVEQDLDGTRDGWSFGWRYAAYGDYATHLRPYRDGLGDRLLVLYSEDFWEQPGSVADRLAAFLDVPFIDMSAAVSASNATIVPDGFLSQALYRLASNPQKWKSTLLSPLPKTWRRWLGAVVSGAIRTSSTDALVDDSTRDRLSKLFSTQRSELKECYGAPPAAWGGSE